MVNQDIVKYLEEGKKRGFSIQLLKKKLLEASFQEKDVDDAIAAMSVPQTIEPPKKIDLFDKSQDSQYWFNQPTDQKMPLGEAQQMRRLPGQQTTFDQPQTSMWQPGQAKPAVQPLQGIQQKEEVILEKKSEEKKDFIKNGSEGKWMKVGGIMGIAILVVLIIGITMNFFANDFLMGLMQNSLTLLIISIVMVLMFSLYNYAFVRIGKKINQRLLVLGSWFSIVSWILYLVLAVVASLFVYEQAMNFFSGSDTGGSYQITFLILSILWVVALLMHMIGVILSAVGMMKVGDYIKMSKMAGIMNILVFVCALGFLAGIIIFIYSILNAFSSPGAGFDGLDSLMATATIATYSLIGLVALKTVTFIFEIIALFDASKRYEQ